MGKIILNGTGYGGSGGSGGGSGGHTIVDPTGTDMPQENKLQFTGAVSVSDDAVNGQTVVDIEGGGNYYLNTIYSTEEKKVGYWTDGKPLYQKTAYISNISISANSSTNVNISDYFSDVDSAIDFECCDENGNAIFPNVMVNSGLSPYSIGVTVDKSADHITFTRGNGSSATISVCLTLWYTKTTDTPETNPLTGGVIYLPTIYSEEEREVGVWTDGKPLYQKTLVLNNLSVTNNQWAKTNESATGIETIVDGFLIDNQSPSQTFQCDIGVDGGKIAVLTWFVGNSTRTMSYLTFRYTKTTDTAGSGSWTPSGANAVHYSTNEQVIGTWIDGKPLYQKTWDFGNNISINSNTWTNTPVVVASNSIKSVIDSKGMNSGGTIYGFIACNCDQTYVQVLQTRNAQITLRYLTLQYTKTTD